MRLKQNSTLIIQLTGLDGGRLEVIKGVSNLFP